MAFDFKTPPPRPSSGGASPRSDLPRPPGSGPTPPGSGTSGGFRNVPQPRSTPQPPAVRPDPARGRGQGGRVPRPPRPARQPRGGGFAIPWTAVILLVLLAAVLIFCYCYRDVITEFLAQVLSWVIILLIIYLVLRRILFGRRR